MSAIAPIKNLFVFSVKRFIIGWKFLEKDAKSTVLDRALNIHEKVEFFDLKFHVLK